MTKEALIELKKKISKLSEKEKKERDLYLRKLATGELQGPPIGYASIDKPWFKFYNEEAICAEPSVLSIYEVLKENNRNNKGNAINYFGRKISYNQLIKRVDKVANAFISMGVKPGDIVTLSLPNIPENVICLYALNKIGAIANMIDLRLKGEKLKNAVNSTGSKFLISTDLFIENLNEVYEDLNVEKVIIASPFDSMPAPLKFILKRLKKIAKTDKIIYDLWDDFEDLGNVQLSSKIEYKSKPETPICILHTSGTTGSPKGVVLTNMTFNAMVTEYKDNIVRVEPGDKILCQVPPFLAYSAIMAIHLPLSLGIQLEMLPDYNPEKFADNIYKHKTNHAVAGPADWSSFLENEKVSKRDYSFLKTLGSGSDKIDTEKRHKIDEKLKRKFGVMEGYGMTEVGSAAVTNLPEYIVDDSVGIPLSKIIVGIFSPDTGEELGYGQTGEICFNGLTMMKEYFNNPDATSETIREHSDGTKWIHSGDIGYMDENGNVFLQGRIKRIIVRHDGIKIFPTDIEKVISKLPFVLDCCVVGIPDDEHGYGFIPVANVVLNGNCNSEELIAEILTNCQSQLGEKYLPKKILIVDELPLTDVGKVNYRKLEESSYNNKCKKKI